MMAILIKSVICVALFLLFPLHGQCSSAEKKSYIVYLGSHSHGRDAAPEVHAAVENSHYEFLSKYLGSHEKAKDAIIYSYQKHINGFAAVLSDDEAIQIRKDPDVISVFLNKMNKIQTTNSWKFMGLEHKSGAVPHKSLWRKANFGEDVIIGHLDTGVWPESKSFSDEGYGPIPSRWRGVCQNNTASPISCNRKLIGARYFAKGYLQDSGDYDIDPSMMSPRDFSGHGTHTLSTSGGNFVSGVDLFGLGRGTAKGGAPRARLASYKVCWSDTECSDADVIAAFDAAINDGVDVISISLAAGNSRIFYLYFSDSIGIGSFHAVKHGITVVAAAGNSGPYEESVANVAPWLLTVAASTQDRDIRNYIKVQTHDKESSGGGHHYYKWFKGESYSEPFPDNGTLYPFITGDHAAIQRNDDASMCKPGTLNAEMVKGKILVCLMDDEGDDGGRYAADIGAAGLVYYNTEDMGDQLYPEPYLLPAIGISYHDGVQLLALINTTSVTLGSITAPATKYNVRPAPLVAPFSSRGPSHLSPTVLKPDITAPGVDILAAYSDAAPISPNPSYPRRVPYMLMSGTSMSTPHVAGVVALLKSVHPDWSPAAIKSAIMTTAMTVDNRYKRILDHNNKEATPFGYGAGHITANRADNPGLVYDMSTKDYLYILCAQIDYSPEGLKTFLQGEDIKCPNSTGLVDLINYPAIMVPHLNKTITVPRRVKNVGSPGTYRAFVRAPNGVSVTVTPDVLTFKGLGEEKEFTVTIDQIGTHPKSTVDYYFGEMAWSDGKHFVKSPIGVRFSAETS